MTVFCLTLSTSGHLCLNDVSPEGMYCTCDALASQQVQVKLTSYACLVIQDTVVSNPGASSTELR